MVFKKKRVWHCLPGQEPTELDKRVMYWENKGKEVPSRDLIKTPEQIEGVRRSGVVNTGVLDEVAKHIHAGMNTLEIDQICYAYCTAHGAVPACLNYEGFPKSVCTSINEVVCHGIPKEEDVLQEGDIVNVDFTTILDGYYADASRMFIIGKTTPEKEQLVRVACGRHRSRHTEARRQVSLWHRARPMRSWRRIEVPREARRDALRTQGYGYAACAGHGVHN